MQWLVYSFHGILLFQFLFIIFQYIISKKRDYLFYAIYILMSLLYFIYIHHYNWEHNAATNLQSIILKEFSQWLPILNIVIYSSFINSFLEIKKSFLGGYKVIHWIQRIILYYFIIDLFSILFFKKPLSPFVYDAGSVVMFFLIAYVLRGLLKRRNKLVNYILAGTGSVFLSLIFSTILIFKYKLVGAPLGHTPFLISYAGVVTELLFFSIALINKAAIVEKEKVDSLLALERVENEKRKLQLGIYEMRNKISSDLHDQVGSTLYSVSLYSQIAKTNSGQLNSNTAEMLNRIEDASRSMLAEMNDIVWTLNPVNDNLKKITERMESFAVSLCVPSNIQPNISFAYNPGTNVENMQIRKNLFLVFKEAVTNCVKYSGATNINIDGYEQQGALHLTIEDNGRGFDRKKIKKGNGLSNMENRVKEVGGSFQISTEENNGTVIYVSIPLPNNG